MRLFVTLLRHRASPELGEWLWDAASTDRASHEKNVQRYADAGGDRYDLRVAEFVEVAHAPTDRPPAPTEVPADSIHGPGGTGC